MRKTDAMNADDILDYALGKLDSPRREQVEDELGRDPAAAARAQRARRVIHRLLDDGLTLEPPPDLSRQTLLMVARSRSRTRAILDQVPSRLPLRWADFAVAASIFIAGFLTLIPAVQRSRDRMNQAGCVFNLQQIGSSLAQYASLHPAHPYPSGQSPETHAGMFAAQLHDAGVLPDLTVLDCPSNGPCPQGLSELPSFDQVDRIRRTDPERYRRMLCWDYAYNVGARQRPGRAAGPDTRTPYVIPVVADQPPFDEADGILAGNSPNHHSRGQNVLYRDNSVRWLNSRRVSEKDLDLFLNNDRKVEPGVHEQDSVLLPSKLPWGGLKAR